MSFASVVIAPPEGRCAAWDTRSFTSIWALIRPPEDIIRYLDERAASGPPWDCRVPREARERLVGLKPGRAVELPVGGPEVGEECASVTFIGRYGGGCRQWA